MQQTQMMSGFSELKDHLISTFHIQKSREKIRLHFTQNDDRLRMHDYHNHQNFILIADTLRRESIWDKLTGNARLLCILAIQQKNPADYLNQGFNLYGHFRF